MHLYNKIEAIKQVRALAHNVRIEQNLTTGVYEIRTNLDLRTTKELVEAIMELGATEIRNEVVALRNRVQIALDGDVRF